MSESQSLTIKTDAASVLAELRRTIREMMDQIPGDLRRPKDLQLLLGVEYKLCWQILNIARAEDPLSISQYVPGMTSVKKMLAAARTHGVPEEILLDVERAMKSFKRVVATHADDRRGFDTMVSSLSEGGGAELIALQHRRDAFRSESQIWGSQLKAYVLQMIWRKSVTGSGYDRCYVSSKFGMRSLRQNVTPIVHGYRDTASGPIPAERIEPLDAAAAEKYGSTVLSQFSTRPIPSFKTVQHRNGYTYTTLDSAEIGRKSAVNMVFGGVVRNAKMERDEAEAPTLLCGAAITAPTELVVVELLVHRASFKNLIPQVRIHTTGSVGNLQDPTGVVHQFPIYEQVDCLGSAVKAPAVAESPSYRRQMEYAFAKLGWELSEFDVFRLRIPYPVLNTRVRIACPISEPDVR